MEVLKQIQEALRPLRLAIVSKETGINHTTLHQLAKGEGNPKLSTLEKLTKYLGIKVKL